MTCLLALQRVVTVDLIVVAKESNPYQTGKQINREGAKKAKDIGTKWILS